MNFSNATVSTNKSTTNSDFDFWLVLRLVATCPLFIVALIGNLLIIATKLFRWRRKQAQLVDLLLSMLALCDIIKTVAYFLIAFRVTNVRCICAGTQKMLLCMFSMSTFITTYLMYLRYYAIRHPMKKRLPYWKERVVTVAICTAHATLYVQPELFSYQVETHSGLQYCKAHTPENPLQETRFYGELLILVVMLFPSLIIMTTLLMLVRKLLAMTSIEKLTSAFKHRLKQNKTAVCILTSIYLAYITSSIPWITLFLASSIDAKMFLKIIGTKWNIILDIFIAGSFCNSFLTYLTYSKEFRRDIKRLLRISDRRINSTRLSWTSDKSKK